MPHRHSQFVIHFMSFHSNIGNVNAPEYQNILKLHLLLYNVTGFLIIHRNKKTWLHHCNCSSMKLRARYKLDVHYISYI